MIAAGTVPLLLAGLLADDPGRPRLTWYGPAGERVEFSAKVLGNWVAKTANLLVEEFEAEPGRTVHLALPTHWRTLVWMLATWSTGAHVSLAGLSLDRDDVLVAADPQLLADAGPARTAAVALPALATTFGSGLPAGAVDTGVEVRLQPDAFIPLLAPEPADLALTLADGTAVDHGHLLDLARAHAHANLGDHVRVLTDAPPAEVVTGWLPALVANGSLVLHHDLASLSPEQKASLELQEQVTPRI